jgi:hypothetical protein
LDGIMPGLPFMAGKGRLQWRSPLDDHHVHLLEVAAQAPGLMMIQSTRTGPCRALTR